MRIILVSLKFDYAFMNFGSASSVFYPYDARGSAVAGRVGGRGVARRARVRGRAWPGAGMGAGRGRGPGMAYRVAGTGRVCSLGEITVNVNRSVRSTIVIVHSHVS